MQSTSDSNPAQNESFDALIDLLASDDVVDDPRFRDTGQPPVNENLRDSDGRMNLSKIHSFFAGNEQGEEPNHSSSSRRNPVDDTAGSQNAYSLSPRPRQSPHSATSAPLGTSPGTSYLSRSNATTPAESSFDPSEDEDGDESFHGAANSRALGTAGSSRSHSLLSSQLQSNHQSTSLDDLHYMDREPLEVEALSQALRLANAEVKELRDQCDDLRSMVSPLQRTGYGDSVKNSPKVPPPTGFHYTSSRKQSGLPPEIADLSEDEAKEALVSLLSSLSLPASSLPHTSPQNDSILNTATRPTDIASIQRALGFVIQTDELIWRRTRSSGPGAPKARVFDDENINALGERLELWERVIRTARS